MGNLIEIKDNWNETKGKLKEKFATLNVNEFFSSNGNQDEFMGRLQMKLGKTRDEIHSIIFDL